MKNLSLLILSLIIALSAMADAKSGAPLRFDGSEGIFGEEYSIYQRSNQGSAINPDTHTSMVPQDGTIEIVFSKAEKKAYIKNIVYGAVKELGEYWVEGEWNDTTGTITIPIEQDIYIKYASGRFVKSATTGAALTWGTVHHDAVSGNTSFDRDLKTQTIIYQIEGNTIVIEHTSGPVAVDSHDDYSFDATGPAIIWMDEDSEDGYIWAGYCEWGTILDINTPYIIDWQPEGESKTYNRTSDCIHYTEYTNSKGTLPTFSTEKLSDKCEIVFNKDGRTVYMKDPLLSLKKNTWVKGSLNNNVIEVELPQYLCYNDYDLPLVIRQANCWIKNAFVYPSTYFDALYAEVREEYHTISFIVDGNTITLWDTYADFNAPYPDNFKGRGLHVYDPDTNMGVLEANIVYVLDSDTPIEPTEKTSAPVINGYSENDGHAYRIEVTPTEPSTIYVRTLYSNGYSEWLPYSAPIWFTTPGEYVVEAYALADGKLASDIVSHEFEVSTSTGINEATTSKAIVNTRYFNVMGQQIQQPNGMTIVVTTYSDGTTTAVKVMK